MLRNDFVFIQFITVDSRTEMPNLWTKSELRHYKSTINCLSGLQIQIHEFSFAMNYIYLLKGSFAYVSKMLIKTKQDANCNSKITCPLSLDLCPPILKVGLLSSAFSSKTGAWNLPGFAFTMFHENYMTRALLSSSRTAFRAAKTGERWKQYYHLHG